MAWCCVVCVLVYKCVYVCTFDVYVHHHHSLLHSGCTRAPIQLSLLNTYVQCTYVQRVLWDVANICGLAIYSDWNAKTLCLQRFTSLNTSMSSYKCFTCGMHPKTMETH